MAASGRSRPNAPRPARSTTAAATSSRTRWCAPPQTCSPPPMARPRRCSRRSARPPRARRRPAAGAHGDPSWGWTSSIPPRWASRRCATSATRRSRRAWATPFLPRRARRSSRSALSSAASRRPRMPWRPTPRAARASLRLIQRVPRAPARLRRAPARLLRAPVPSPIRLRMPPLSGRCRRSLRHPCRRGRISSAGCCLAAAPASPSARWGRRSCRARCPPPRTPRMLLPAQGRAWGQGRLPLLPPLPLLARTRCSRGQWGPMRSSR
mmetsp:Transcript_5656/g.22325  ORF Transcript_5656/g.22325 Transcript_5656/m.22325 type:complete len:267 (-) Transcript_5656:2042-2842(-)